MATETDTLLLQIKADNKQLLSKLSQTEKATTKAASSMTKAMGAFGVAFGAAFAIQGIKNIALASDEMVRLNARLVATTGSAKKAAEAMGFLRDTAKRQSVDLLDLSNAYTRLLPAVQSNVISMDDMRKILTLANDNIKAIGLSGTEAQGVFLGLSQALGSGTVTMEDLRQVTDRLPGSLNRMAKAAGKSVNEYKKFIATGTATADMIKDDLITAFQDNEGAAEKMAGTLESAIARLTNATRELNAALGESGLNTLATGAIDLLTGIATAATGAAEGVDKVVNAFKLFGGAGLTFGGQGSGFPSSGGAAGGAIDGGGAASAKEILPDFLSPENEGFSPTARDDEDPTTRREAMLEELREIEEEKREIRREADELRKSDEQELQESLNAIILDAQGVLGQQTRRFLAQMDAARKTSGMNQVQASIGALQTILGESSKHNKKLFELNKAAGIANAIMSTAGAIMKGYEQLGPIAGSVAAVGLAVVGAAQIATISSQSFSGGGGGAASPAASTAVAPTAGGGGGGGGGGGDSFINITPIDRDATYSGQQIDDIISGINDRIDSGATIKGINVG